MLFLDYYILPAQYYLSIPDFPWAGHEPNNGVSHERDQRGSLWGPQPKHPSPSILHFLHMTLIVLCFHLPFDLLLPPSPLNCGHNIYLVFTAVFSSTCFRPRGNASILNSANFLLEISSGHLPAIVGRVVRAPIHTCFATPCPLETRLPLLDSWFLQGVLMWVLNTVIGLISLCSWGLAPFLLSEAWQHTSDHRMTVQDAILVCCAVKVIHAEE